MRTQASKFLTFALFSTPLFGVACAPMEQEGGMHESEASGFNSANGLGSINGLSSANGLGSVNGLSSANGLASANGLGSVNGLASANGLMTTTAGRSTVTYIVKCALPAGRSITKSYNGVSYTFPGLLGVAPEWETGACGTNCQQHVSACVLAHVNTTGQNVSLWLDGDSPALGWGQNAAYPYQEGSFFGNIFVSPPTMYYCNGKDFATGTVPGRIGANGTTGPYTNPFGGGSGYCNTSCVKQDIPNQNDGYKACHGFNHVVTVWRNVDTSSLATGSSAQFDPNMEYKVCSRSSGKCLDIAGGSTSNSALVVQNTYSSSSTSMRWNITQVSTGKYKFTNKKSGKVMDIYGQRTADGTPLLQYTYSGSPNQLWSFTRTGDGFYKFSPGSNPGSALDVPGYSTANGTGIVQWTYSGNQNQQWTVAPAN